MKTVKVDDIKASLPIDAIILDVRTDIEHKEECLACAHDHVPLDTLDAGRYMLEKRFAKDKPLYLLCRAGSRACKAAEAFEAYGCTNVHVIEGGLTACRAGGMDCQCDAGIISLERQVRITAGVLVLIGAVLGITIHRDWHLLSAAIGGGLIFSGLTNWCGLAMLLSRAPWNRC